MKKWTRIVSAALLACGFAAHTTHAAVPTTAQGLVTGKGFYNLTGTAPANLTNAAKFPNSPDALFFFPYFEWAATGDISTAPGNFADNYGGQISGYFYPPSTGDYIFRLAADDNARLYLSTNSTTSGKRLIASETIWSNPRQYDASGGVSDLNAKDSSLFAATEWPTKDASLGGAKITLQAGQPYYIEAIFKEGTGGDNLSVSVADPLGVIDSTMPIPGEYLSSDRNNGAVSIATQPASQTVAERGSVTFRVMPDGTPPYTYQWRKGGVDITDATNLTYTVSSVATTDNAARYSVVVTGAEGTITSSEAVLTVNSDTAAPTLLNAKSTADRAGLVLTFSEPVDPTSGATTANYQISSSTGPLSITAATVSGTQVILTTAAQTLGTKYTLLASNVKDTAATPNTLAANSSAIFFPAGKVVEQNGFIVFEAENYDRNLDGLWVRNTSRGIPSGGASMIIPNGAGGSETATKLEYDVEFAQAGTYTVWYRASADVGEDDSAWLHLDGERPAERATGNMASMTGFQPQTDFVWRSDAQDPPDPFTIDIATPGMHTIGLARREDGAVFDKFLFTTNATYTPTGFGPPETREGAPGLPTAAITAPTAGQTFAVGGNINLTANVAGQSGLNITRVEYTANGNPIGTSSNAPFSLTWNGVAAGVYGIRATAYDELGQAVTSDSIAITVGTPPPQALLVVGTDSIPNLNASDAAYKARLESQGWQVVVMPATATTPASAEGKQLIIVSATVASGDVAAKFLATTVPVITMEQAIQDDLLLTLNTDGTHRGTVTGQTQLNIVNATHPLAAGLAAGLVTTTTNGQDYVWGAPAAGATVIATIAADTNRASIYAYEQGATLINGTSTAAGKRVTFFTSNNGFAAGTADTVKLFDAAVQWASGITPAPAKTSANIAWISFHRADDAPSAAAATAGFTNAADRAYTDMLKAAGHTVTRFVTTGAPDTNVLNAFDLVIISRSVPSGDYQDPPETAAWNGLTAPTMVLGGYIARSSRLGLMAGTTIPDTTGSIGLAVTDPTHPIFEGIALSGGTMVNDYAMLTTYNGRTNRGISVVTGDVAGGATVLATVATASDPTVGGTIIAEYQKGATLANGTASVLGGDRLLFLTGSREYDGLTSEGSGIIDLTDDGRKMFLNAVAYMAGVEPGAGGATPTVAIRRNTDGTITVTFTGTLQESTNLTTWTDVAGATGSITVPATDARRFYRARR